MKENFKRPTIAICYDFDKTLSPKDMQAYGFIDKLNMTPAEFWAEKEVLSEKHYSDGILTYMYYSVKKYQEKGLNLTRQDLVDLGKNIELFKGVKKWFERINKFGLELGVNIEHYIISSGITPILEGTEIAKEFKQIFACEFMYNDDGQPIWPALAVDYTTKTQFLYRINKGLLDIRDSSVNAPMDKRKRPIPFKNIIYIGDSATDIPCMRLTVKSGGHAIGVYNPENKIPQILLELVRDNRINFFAPADYSEFGTMDTLIKEIILKIRHSNSLAEYTYSQKDEAKEKLEYPLLYMNNKK